MSSTLSGYIQSELKKAYKGDEYFETNKFADAMALAIQMYLNSNVKVNPGQATVGGPTAQATVSPGILNAP
jgi:hypothetical protein